MWVEERTYRLLPGRTRDYFSIYESKGMALQRKYIPIMLGYYSSELGNLNEVVHFWGHDSLDAREHNRARMRADPEFQAYWEHVRELIVEQRTRILRPAPFFAEAVQRMRTISNGAGDCLDTLCADRLFRQARSHTAWQDAPVSDATLRRLHELMKWGPTSMNCQPLRVQFVVSSTAKARLLPALQPGNVEKCRLAPVIAILGYDTDFSAHLPRMFPHIPSAREMYESDTALQTTVAFRNATLQAGYFIVAARMLGLDAGPLSGFVHEKIDAAFWGGSSVKTNLLCMLGHGKPESLHARLPRFDFDEVCSII